MLVNELVLYWKTNSEQGLSSDQVVAARKRYGTNQIHEQESRVWLLLWRQINSSFVYLLFFAALLSLLLGEFLNGGMIFFVIAIMVLFGFYQEYFAEKTLLSLRSRITYHVKVRRNGQFVTLASQELVPGDIVIVEPGDLIVADMRLIEVEHCTIDESTLTGESVAVVKTAEPLPKAEETLFGAHNIVFAGTKAVSGSAVAVVIATGNETVLGSLATVSVKQAQLSSFTEGIHKFSVFILYFVIATLTVLFTANLLIKWPHVDIWHMLLFSISLAVAVVPEALNVVINFSLAIAANRLARKKVLVKRFSAIEDLGSIEVLCLDKTGTITENILSIKDILRIHVQTDAELVQTAAYAAATYHRENQLDSFDKALFVHESCNNFVFDDAIKKAYIPFDPERKRVAAVIDKQATLEFIVRGAFEELIKLCAPAGLGNVDAERAWIKKQGELGRRVLAVAQKTIQTLPDDSRQEEHTLQLLGLIAFEDTLKESAQDALAKAQDLGVQIKILTGDSADVAAAIGKQVGLVQSVQEVMTGAEFEALSHEQKQQAAHERVIFARVAPQQKYEIIKTIAEQRDVGFLGEGINDVPALKLATVGLVVDNATDSAKDAADIVLFDKSLHVIIDGVIAGRRIFSNTLKYLKLTIASNFSNFYTLAVVSLLSKDLPMLPLQLLVVNILSDLPMIVIATDTVERKDLANPTSYKVRNIILTTTIFGIVCTVFDFIFFSAFYDSPVSVLQTNWFLFSIFMEICFFYSIRTRRFFLSVRRPTNIIQWALGGCSVIALLLPYTRFGQVVLHFTPPTMHHLGIIALIVGTNFIAAEIVKYFWYKLTPVTEMK